LTTPTISEICHRLEEEYGNPDWWPAETPFEVAVGAILTQRTSWRNVEIAIEALRRADLLTPAGLLSARREEVERFIRPSGFYKQKTARLLEFASFIEREHHGDILNLSRAPVNDLRRELLRLPGIGPETADAILLYALGLPSFVVDAYTMRFLRRIGVDVDGGYDSVKGSFEDCLGVDCPRMARIHALIVIHCKNRCKPVPVCHGCPFTGCCVSEAEE
jgi:endonuclease-3 related protein